MGLSRLMGGCIATAVAMVRQEFLHDDGRESRGAAKLKEYSLPDRRYESEIDSGRVVVRHDVRVRKVHVAPISGCALAFWLYSVRHPRVRQTESNVSYFQSDSARFTKFCSATDTL